MQAFDPAMLEIQKAHRMMFDHQYHTKSIDLLNLIKIPLEIYFFGNKERIHFF